MASDERAEQVWSKAVVALHDSGLSWDEIADRLGRGHGRRFAHGLALGFQINERTKQEITDLMFEEMSANA